MVPERQRWFQAREASDRTTPPILALPGSLSRRLLTTVVSINGHFIAGGTDCAIQSKDTSKPVGVKADQGAIGADAATRSITPSSAPPQVLRKLLLS